MSPVIGVKVKLNLNRRESVSANNLLAKNKFNKNKLKFRSIPSLVPNRAKWAASPSSHRIRRNLNEELSSAELVTFRVGEQKRKFTAHPGILSSKSEVFRRMLESPHWNMGHTVTIVDVKPEAFKLLLISVTSGVKGIHSLLNVPLALDTYYAAHKYNVVDLEIFLIKFLHRNATADNILELLDHAQFYGLHVLEGFCWSVIEKQALQVVRSDAFPYINWDNLCGILENNRLSIGEFDLFHGVYRWCTEESRLPQNASKSIHEIIGVAIYKLRFPLMTPSEFDKVIQSGILKIGEIADLKSNFRKNTTYPHRVRRNDCDCRRNRLPCKLCTCDHSPLMPVDGRNLNILKKLFKPIVANSLIAVPISSDCNFKGKNNNNNIIGEDYFEQEINCECMKYFSCPAYPQGVSASIMVATNMFP